jgi:hypothetical protein
VGASRDGGRWPWHVLPSPLVWVLVFRRPGLGLPLGRLPPASASDSSDTAVAVAPPAQTRGLPAASPEAASSSGLDADVAAAAARRASVLLQSRVTCRRLDPITGPRRPASRCTLLPAPARAPPRKGNESSCCCGLCRDDTWTQEGWRWGWGSS